MVGFPAQRELGRPTALRSVGRRLRLSLCTEREQGVTLSSRLGYGPKKETRIDVPDHIAPRDISIVIPVRNNQAGVDRLLQALSEFGEIDKPREVVVVDNLSTRPIRLRREFPFQVIATTCDRRGPAAARNDGARITTGKWLLFLDSDCIPTRTTVAGYTSSNNCQVAYAGYVQVNGTDRLSVYYRSQETLLPPKTVDGDVTRPDYLVTANCLVAKNAFDAIGGFDESFTQAGGEDIDLAFRLLRIGDIAYQWNSCVEHSFDDGLRGFVARFVRYGRGNRQLAEKYHLQLHPRPFVPELFSLSNAFLAWAQFLAMTWGYRSIIG